MKKFFGIAVLSIAMGLSAFTHAPQAETNKFLSTYWFKFIGTDASDPTQRNNPNMYEKQNGGARVCYGTGTLCEIHAQEASSGSVRPNLNTEDSESYLP